VLVVHGCHFDVELNSCAFAWMNRVETLESGSLNKKTVLWGYIRIQSRVSFCRLQANVPFVKTLLWLFCYPSTALILSLCFPRLTLEFLWCVHTHIPHSCRFIFHSASCSCVYSAHMKIHFNSIWFFASSLDSFILQHYRQYNENSDFFKKLKKAFLKKK